jgi:hypothetical protein
VSAWKKQAKEYLLGVFGIGQQTDDNEELIAALYEKIGRLEVKLDWIKKNQHFSISKKRMMIGKHNGLSIKE